MTAQHIHGHATLGLTWGPQTSSQPLLPILVPELCYLHALTCAMTGSAASMCSCGVIPRSPLQSHSLDRPGSSCGAWSLCVKPHQRLCERLMGRGSMLDRPLRFRRVCNSAEPDWDAEMSLFRKRTMKPNQMETVRRLEEEVDIGKVRQACIMHQPRHRECTYESRKFCFAARCYSRTMAWPSWRD